MAEPRPSRPGVESQRLRGSRSVDGVVRPGAEVAPIAGALSKIFEKDLHLVCREAADPLEMHHRWLDEPTLEAIGLERELDFGNDLDLFESHLSQPGRQFARHESVAKLVAGQPGEPTPQLTIRT